MRTRLREYLDRAQPHSVTETEWKQLLTELAPVSEGYLRRLLRESGLPLAALVEGVRQDSLPELERTLVALASEYEAGSKEHKGACRRLVITAKDHARWSGRRSRPLKEEKPEPKEKPEKDEVLLWLLTWLENPSLFPSWLELRKRALRE